MIPLHDDVPRVHPPIAVVVLIVINVLVFLYEVGLDPHSKVRLFHFFGVVPNRFLNPEWAAFAGYPEASVVPFFSYMFLHGGWLHLILNMWMLWIFGDNIEDVTGHGWFVLFYVLCGLVAVGVHILSDTSSAVPVVGASGAVAGVMGAYMVLYPHGKVQVLVPVFFFPLFFRIPSVLFLGVWGASQFLSGVLTIANGAAQSVAVWAHVGGFVAGIALITVFRVRERCYYCYDPDFRDYDKPTERRP